MRHVRAAVRATALCLHTLVWFVALLATRMLALVAPRRGTRARIWVKRTWARGVAWLLGVRTETVGSAPEAPFFLVCNHLSYVDIIVLLTLADCVFVAKSDVAHWPVIGLLARVSGTLFVDRARKADLPRAIALVERTLAEDVGVVVFPEGTSTEGSEVLQFKPSIFEVPARTRRPVWCASLSYATGSAAHPPSTSVCWWGDMTFGRHIYGLLQIPCVRARVAFGADPIVHDDRKALARAAHRSVQAQFTPVVG